ncbi:MFS transporter [Cellulomonas sp. zg-ZUI188]|uniref:MFS transporter n=2 Tax=Cellulomonas fengjieae TaxID=2819978 RepID=A0ABS3SC85_9CELL|nr:MFS transporter [Cellulomonas fengjieae]MBO3083367.1 MFS transporter [Cellulomonas fengjieae]QVI65291.1 MFS transporter [Cellulomonas fengjieae]
MAPSSESRMAVRVLVLSTTGFLLNFWAWALISPLGGAYRESLDLTGVQQSVLVAVPVIVGSLGRIPIGALTDRIGSRTMFPVVTVATIVPVLFIGFVAETYAAMLVGGFFLGLGGTAFAIGVPAVNQWFAPERRGTALGIFGLGMGGTAISAFTTVRLTDTYGPEAPFVLVACVLAVYAVVAALFLRDKPGRAAPQGSFLARTWATAKIPATGQLSLLYALGFGGFVAFSVYLPTYLVNAYDLTAGDAAARTAGFVVLAVAMRPVGGSLSDRIGPVPVLLVSFAAVGVLALVAALELSLMPLGTIAFLGLAAALGASSGAVFALVAQVAPADKVGAVTGIVGAAGGLGGFFPPLVMGAVYDRTGDYSLGYVLLAVSALAVAWFTWGPVRRAARARESV